MPERDAPDIGLINSLKRIPRLLKELSESAPRACYIALLLHVLTGILPVTMLAITGLLIDALSDAQRAHYFSMRLWYLLLLEAIAALSLNGVSRYVAHYDLVLSRQFSLHLNLRVIAHCNNRDLQTFESSVFQDCLHRAKEQVPTQVAFVGTVLHILEQLIGISAVLVSTLFVAPFLMAAQLVGVLPLVLWESRYVRHRYLMNWRRTPVRRMLDYLQSIVTTTAPAKEIKLFSAGTYLYDRYDCIARAHNLEDAILSKRSSRAAVWLSSSSSLVYYAAYAFLLHRTVVGSLSIGQLIFLAGLLVRFSSNLFSLLTSLFLGYDQLLGITNALAFFPASSPALKMSADVKELPFAISGGIEFRNVSFKYADAVETAVNNVSFRVNPGEIVALVGENGAGKSTIAKLITRLYEPSSGQILLNGADLKEYSQTTIRRTMTAIFQDFIKYDLSASINVAIGDVSAVEDPRRIENAALKAGADSFISCLPNRYEQILGRRFDNGLDLSGGQWQRLALARAYVRDARIIVLDEPSASVDARTEAALYRDVMQDRDGKIIVLISHRLSTVRFADRILVMKHGAICEVGTHSELMVAGGEYAELFTLQARAYS